MSWFAQIEPFAHHPGSGALVGYFLGCFTTGYYLVRWKTGQDIRQIGSGSSGARNVGRQLGKIGFILTLLGDYWKGAAAVLLTRWLTGANETAILLTILGVVVGHIWPAQLGFRGGKGVATCLGALSFFSFYLAVSYCIVAAIGIVIMRKSVIPGLVAFALLPAIAYFLRLDTMALATISVLACIILTAHYRNVIQEINQLFARQPDITAQTKAESTKS